MERLGWTTTEIINQMKIHKWCRTSTDSGESGLGDNRDSLHSPLKYYTIVFLFIKSRLQLYKESCLLLFFMWSIIGEHVDMYSSFRK